MLSCGWLDAVLKMLKCVRTTDECFSWIAVFEDILLDCADCNDECKEFMRQNGGARICSELFFIHLHKVLECGNYSEFDFLTLL
jgi:hypothetical protein